jgi:hypothetical protein
LDSDILSGLFVFGEAKGKTEVILQVFGKKLLAKEIVSVNDGFFLQKMNLVSLMAGLMNFRPLSRQNLEKLSLRSKSSFCRLSQ